MNQLNQLVDFMVIRGKSVHVFESHNMALVPWGAIMLVTADPSVMVVRALLFAAIGMSYLLGSHSWAKDVSAEKFFNSPAQVSLAKAAAEGRVDEMDALLARGADVNATGVDGMTVLHWALSNHSKRAVSWLLDHGANPNVTFTGDGTCATSLAAKQEDPWFLKQVLSHGGDMNARNPLNGRTPLVEAMASGQNENAQTLISSGADLNTRDSLGLTPLIGAAMNQKYELVYDMLLAGADPMVKIGSGKTLLWVVRRLRLPPDAPAYQWQLKVIELLKQKGFDVEHGD
jgi:hypothetical protein